MVLVDDDEDCCPELDAERVNMMELTATAVPRMTRAETASEIERALLVITFVAYRTRFG